MIVFVTWQRLLDLPHEMNDMMNHVVTKQHNETTRIRFKYAIDVKQNGATINNKEQSHNIIFSMTPQDCLYPQAKTIKNFH